MAMNSEIRTITHILPKLDISDILDTEYKHIYPNDFKCDSLDNLGNEKLEILNKNLNVLSTNIRP